jgi:hypothetical protein
MYDVPELALLRSFRVNLLGRALLLLHPPLPLQVLLGQAEIGVSEEVLFALGVTPLIQIVMLVLLEEV